VMVGTGVTVDAGERFLPQANGNKITAANRTAPIIFFMTDPPFMTFC
jgi:hypothetical protein